MKNWYALYIKSNAERKTAEYLAKQGFTVYCPLHTVVRQWSDRKKKLQLPLFRSYLFIQLEQADPAEAVLQAPGVVGFVKWLGKRALIKDKEIAAIQQFLNQYQAVEISSLGTVEPGDSLAVESGALMGKSGTVVGQSRHKVKLLIEQLGVQLIAEVPKSHLRPLL